MEEDTKKQADKKINGTEAVKKELEEAKAKCEEYLNGWKRERADFLNYKKDEMERIGQLVKYANEEIILKIIPILDNIYLAESHIPDDLKTHEWTKGFSQIKSQLCDFLKKEGIEPIKSVGDPSTGSGQVKFDPNTMEAVGEAEGGDKGTVVEEVQRGYTLHGKVIRVAKVRVAK